MHLGIVVTDTEDTSVTRFLRDVRENPTIRRARKMMPERYQPAASPRPPTPPLPRDAANDILRDAYKTYADLKRQGHRTASGRILSD
jgi:hypothetical protein